MAIMKEKRRRLYAAEEKKRKRVGRRSGEGRGKGLIITRN